MQNNHSKQSECSIKICSQGHVHLHMGSTTLHMNFEEFTCLVKTSFQAIEKYQQTFPENMHDFQSTLAH